MIAAMTAVRSAASDIAKRAMKRLSTALPAAADKNAEQHASDKHDHRCAERALFHFLDVGLRRSLGFAPAALGRCAKLVCRVRATIAGGILQNFRDLHKVGTQILQLGAQRLNVCVCAAHGVLGVLAHAGPFRNESPLRRYGATFRFTSISLTPSYRTAKDAPSGP